jgi:hypothetical protein
VLSLLSAIDLEGSSPLLVVAAAAAGSVATVGAEALYGTFRRRRTRRIGEKDISRARLELPESKEWARSRDYDVFVAGTSAPPSVPRGELPHRYANVVLTDLDGVRPVLTDFGAKVLLSVDIGPLNPFSDVEDEVPRPFPDEVLPREDLEIAVVLSSAELDVGSAAAGEGEWGSAAEGQLLLPRDGGPARCGDGSSLCFPVFLPAEPQVCRARLSYLYRDAVVQSQRLDLTIRRIAEGRCVAMLSAVTDFTVSEYLGAELDGVPDRPRVSVVVNASSSDEHEVTIRSPTRSPRGSPTSFRLKEPGIGKVVADIRERLGERSPTSIRRSPQDLRTDLQTLAQAGWRLYAQLSEEGRQMISRAKPEEIVQVVIPRESGFTIPWHLVYDIFVEGSVNPREIPICPVVDELDDEGFAFDPSTRQCPHLETESHEENLLCPFGFWGFRHTFEVLTSAKSPETEIEVGAPPRVVLALTEVGVNKKALAGHFEKLTKQFRSWSADAVVQVARSREELRSGLIVDLPFVYFLCHGSRSELGATVLSVGKKDQIEPSDFEGWVEIAGKGGHAVWTSPRPLIFINACESLAIDPDDLVGYLGSFIDKARAVGVIGTETRVNPAVAMDVGESFFNSLLKKGASVEEAFWEVKLRHLAGASLAGLLYTPYCFADVHIVS